MFRAPSMAGLPHIETMLDDIPGSLDQVAKHLGISPNTLKTYRRTGDAPRAVMLALFWETRWGRSAADCEAANYGAMYYRKAMNADRELARMAGIILRLEEELARAGTGAANSPVWRVG